LESIGILSFTPSGRNPTSTCPLVQGQRDPRENGQYRFGINSKGISPAWIIGLSSLLWYEERKAKSIRVIKARALVKAHLDWTRLISFNGASGMSFHPSKPLFADNIMIGYSRAPLFFLLRARAVNS